MDTSGILRPEQLPFKVPPDLEYAINELLAAWDATSTRCRLRPEALARKTMLGSDAIMFSMDGGRTMTIDFTNCTQLVNTYEGADFKRKVIYDGSVYMLKFGQKLESDEKKPLQASYSSAPVSEYLGSH